jgi:hypothetical protein
MDHELHPETPGEELQPEKLPELDQPSEAEIDRMADQYKDVERAEEEQRRQQQRESFDKMGRISDELAAVRAGEEEQKPEPSFVIPPEVQSKIDGDSKVFREAFDRLYGQDIFTSPQILKKLAEKGIKPPKTAEELDAEDVAAIKAHASMVHHPRVSRSTTLRRQLPARGFKDKGPPPHIAKDIRGEDN